MSTTVELLERETLAFRKLQSNFSEWTRDTDPRKLSEEAREAVRQVSGLFERHTPLQISSQRISKRMVFSLERSLDGLLESPPTLSQPKLSLMAYPWIWRAETISKHFPEFIYGGCPGDKHQKRALRDPFRRALFLSISYELDHHAYKEHPKSKRAPLDEVKRQLLSLPPKRLMLEAELCLFKLESDHHFGLLKQLCTIERLAQDPQGVFNQVVSEVQRAARLLGLEGAGG